MAFHTAPGNHGRGRRPGGSPAPIYKHVPFHHDLRIEGDPVIPDSNDLAEFTEIIAAINRGRLPKLTVPEPIRVSSDILVVALDTQMIIELYWDKLDAAAEVHWAKLAKTLKDSDARWKIVIGHHPVKTHGPHGGMGYRGWPVNRGKQDLYCCHSLKFRSRLENVLTRQNVAVYAAGHDHSLQMVHIGGPTRAPNQIVSGSAGKTSGVDYESDTFFAQEDLGYVRLDITADAMWVEFRSVDKTGQGKHEALFRIPASAVAPQRRNAWRHSCRRLLSRVRLREPASELRACWMPRGRYLAG